MAAQWTVARRFVRVEGVRREDLIWLDMAACTPPGDAEGEGPLAADPD
jgi:hypothetical protein